ncbi:UNVERIFIED_CONTAM: hypothetical protein PYX00_011625 [Menopon gallinae]|uniref:HTH TFE/IIEalpha-type domain-containing protein n=1 Tax=Menopon gallinae TaxID=328185 RepID=A0AAW2H8U1_9NEOP
MALVRTGCCPQAKQAGRKRAGDVLHDCSSTGFGAAPPPKSSFHYKNTGTIPMEYEDAMKRLLQHFIRKFYDTQHVIVVDILLEKLLMFDSELCASLKILPKEFSKIVFRLREDKLLRQETKIENRENNYQEIKQVFYINYKEIRDVIKYKIFKMTKQLEGEMGKTEEIFVCTTCKKEFSILDAQALMSGFLFKCDECQGLLEESRRVIENDPHNLYEKLMKSLKEIIDMLKEVDKHTIPSFDYFQALAVRRSREEAKDEPVPVSAEETVQVAEHSPVEEDISFEAPGSEDRGTDAAPRSSAATAIHADSSAYCTDVENSKKLRKNRELAMHTQTVTFCTLDEASCKRKCMPHHVSRFLRHMMIDNGTDVIVHALKKSRASFRHVFIAACIYRRSLKAYRLQLRGEESCISPAFATRIRKEHPRIFMEDSCVLFVISLVLGSKIIEDTVYSNHYWAELCLIPHDRIGWGEKYVLTLLNWNIEPREEEFAEMVGSFEGISGNTVLFAWKTQGCLMRRVRECVAIVTQCMGWC